MNFQKSRRRTAHILVLDAQQHLLLFRHFAGGASARHYWRLPGGPLLPGETFKDAGIRLLKEETSIRVSQLDDPIADREHQEGILPGRDVIAEEQYFVVLIDSEGVRLKVRGRAKLPHRWWSSDELVYTKETVRPHDLLAMLVVEGWWA